MAEGGQVPMGTVPNMVGTSASDRTDTSIPSDTDLLDTSHRIISCWKSVGIRLGVDRRTLQNINRNNVEFPSPQEKALEMLFIWRDKGSSSSSMALKEAVRQQLGPDDSDEDDDELCGQAQGLSSTHLASETPEAKRIKTEEIDSGHQAASTSQPANSL